MKLELRTVFGELIFEGDFSSVAELVKAALAAKKSLRSANLRSANLSSANLRSADLRSADLSSANLISADLNSADLSFADLRSAALISANLSSADLNFANLSFADLRSANLSSANLRSANLRSADLRSADLSSADLSSADLRFADLRSAALISANLSSADLSSADLNSADLRRVIKNDFWEILLHAKREVPFLRTALEEGRVNGSSYSGECACLVGTIANARDCSYADLAGIAPDSSRPAERFFLAILPGCTPDKSQHAKLALEWLDELQALMDSPALVSATEPAATPQP